MYLHGSLDNTRRTVEKIVANRAKRILNPEPDVIPARGGVVHRRRGCINALPGSSVGYQGFPGGLGASPAHG